MILEFIENYIKVELSKGKEIKIGKFFSKVNNSDIQSFSLSELNVNYNDYKKTSQITLFGHFVSTLTKEESNKIQETLSFFNKILQKGDITEYLKF